MFIDDLVDASRGGCRAFLDDLFLFTRPWGFHSIADAWPAGLPASAA